MSTAAANPPVPSPLHTQPVRLRVEARKGWQAIDFTELWRYRELLGFLAMRDIKVRYKQTLLGAAWAVLPPLMTMVVFDAIFTLVGRKPSGDVNYKLATFTGAVAWQLFANVLGQSGNSLIANTHLISKVYFPRLIIPLSSVLSALLDFGIALVLLAVMMIWYRAVPGWPIVLLPAFMLLAIIAALAAGLWLSAMAVQYRDIKYIIPFVTQLGMYVSPVIYVSTDLLQSHPRILPLYFLNPMAGVIEGFRWSLLGNTPPPVKWLSLSVIMTGVILVGGLYYFRRMEKTFADLA